MHVLGTQVYMHECLYVYVFRLTYVPAHTLAPAAPEVG